MFDVIYFNPIPDNDCGYFNEWKKEMTPYFESVITKTVKYLIENGFDGIWWDYVNWDFFNIKNKKYKRQPVPYDFFISSWNVSFTKFRTGKCKELRQMDGHNCECIKYEYGQPLDDNEKCRVGFGTNLYEGFYNDQQEIKGKSFDFMYKKHNGVDWFDFEQTAQYLKINIKKLQKLHVKPYKFRELEFYVKKDLDEYILTGKGNFYPYNKNIDLKSSNKVIVNT